MPNTYDPTLRGLNDCDGCEGNDPSTPVKVDNRAGLDLISYRIGTHGRFLQSMLSRLSNQRYPAIRALNVRDPDDLTIALLDACAAADDGLTFYTERYAHEWFVRTADERVSLVQLARLIGYEPRPGVAATAYLAFTMDTTPGTPETTFVEAGTRVMSIPGKNELPQSFEMGATIEARAVWNAMKARTLAPQLIDTEMTQVVLQGIDGGLRKGDSVLIVVSNDDASVKRVQRITQDTKAGTTTLDLTDAPAPSFAGGLIQMEIPSFGFNPSLNDDIFGQVFGGTVFGSSDVSALSMIYGWSSTDFWYAANTPPPTPPPADQGIFTLRQRAAIFGHNAPRWATLPQIVKGEDQQIIGRELTSTQLAKAQYPTDWDDNSVTEDTPDDNVIDLDNAYSSIVENSWIVLESPEVTAAGFRVQKNQELTRIDYSLSVKVSRLTLFSDVSSSFKMRDTSVQCVSEQLPLAYVPIADEVQGDQIVLDAFYPGLVNGQFVIISGTRSDLNGAPGAEVRQLAEVQADGTLETGRLFTRLIFTEPLDFRYHRNTVAVNANVAEATHGESKAEVLGGGDGVTRYQTFALKQQPLTYTSAATPTGTQSSLEVRVDNVRWDEAPTLYGLDPQERAYVIRHEDDGKSKVQFNAPLPSGTENVTARYRIGIGLTGMLKANQLSLLAIKPLGVRSVSNPLAPNGAEDKESIEDLRDNSPLTVLTLDRLVSLQDYEDFARAFAGFSKAQAIATGDAAKRGIFLTVAGETGVIGETESAFTNLVGAIKSSGDPFVGAVVKPYRPAFFQIAATIGKDPAYLSEDVLAAVEMVLRDKFSFEARTFAQPVTQIEVIAAIQNIPGVVFVNLTALFKSDPLNLSLTPTLNPRLDAAPAQPGISSAAQGAELLILDPRPLALNIVDA